MKPRSALLFLTYRCNLRCGFCLSFNSYWRPDPRVPIPSALSPALFLGPVKERREMTAAEIAGRVIPQLEKAGVKSVALSGGEVLARQDIAEIFAALGRSQLSWCFDSNLMLMTEDTAEAVISAGCDTVYVSVDGPELVHNRLRGSPKAFAKTVRGVGMLIDARAKACVCRPEIIVNCVVQPGNEQHADAMVDVAREIGGDRLTFQLLSEHRYAKAFDAPAAVAAFGRATINAAATKFPLAIYPLSDPDEAELVDWFAQDPERNFFSGCDYVKSSLRIDPEGNVIPCMEHRMGNILTEELADIWIGPNYACFRDMLIAEGPFRTCLRCCNLSREQADAAVASP